MAEIDMDILANDLAAAMCTDMDTIASLRDELARVRQERDARPTVVTLCGSTRFRPEYEQANRRLTLQGFIVLSVGLFGHGEPEALSEETKAKLDELHLRKIDLSDEILVVNPGGYIGESTRREIAYATETGKAVKYLADPGGDMPIDREAARREGGGG